MSWKESVRKFLHDCQKENVSLTVEWQGGGDEVFVNFFKDDTPLDYSDPKWQNLTTYLVERLEIPEYGSSSGIGQGVIFLRENDEAYIRYDAFAQYLEEEASDAFGKKLGFEGGKVIPIQSDLLNLLGGEPIDFSFDYSQIKETADKAYYFPKSPFQGELEPYKPQIENLIQQTLLSPTVEIANNFQLSVMGKLGINGIYLEHFFGAPIVVYKDDTQETVFLF